MELELKNKAVVVTGAASNIGRAITLGFAREGANITLADIDEAQAATVAALAREAGAAGAEVVRCDVTQLEQVQAMFARTVERCGTVDVLVNNVGWDRFMYFTQTTPDLWQRLIQVNFVGMLNCTWTALGIMVPKQQGAIVSISSDASRQGEPREAVYGAMKAGINSFMKTIAKENGRYGIRCNVVCPGVTIPGQGEMSGTSMWADEGTSFTPEQTAQIAKSLPLKRMGRPEDVVGTVLLLASNKVASYLTGQVISVSGGYTMIG
ncbi:MAG TPA: SDR family oxidoreductase [Gammaproteobacteria bacterium]|nr:SDR family oxidoreductase [Gammaproteobacteria bacterium]